MQCGIKKIIYMDDKYAGTDSNLASRKMFEYAGVECVQYKKTGKEYDISL